MGAGERPEAERLVATVQAAACMEDEWEGRLSAGLRAGLEFLAADTSRARLLLVDPPAVPGGPDYERGLAWLAEALRPPAAPSDEEDASGEMRRRLLAGGLISHLSGRVLAGEAERIPEDHDLLLRYLLVGASA